MSSPGPLIDPHAFTREACEISKTLPMTAFARLSQAAFERRGEVSYAVRGWAESDGKMWLELEASGSLVLQCQRCLEALDWAFSVANRLLLVPEGRGLPDDELQEDDWDAVSVGSRLDLAGMVEDEVLLALPIAPRHEECRAPAGSDGMDQSSPFAALAKLRNADKA